MDTTFGMLALLMGNILLLIMVTLARKMGEHRDRRTRLEEADRIVREAEHAERERKQRRDHQVNHGRMIYNWLTKLLEKHKDVGVRLWRIEDNGGAFSIIIDIVQGGELQGHVLQLSYDFVKYQEPYLGHIHYGKYGADILFWVGDHAPKNGLDRLVLEEVERVATQLRESAEVRRNSRV